MSNKKQTAVEWLVEQLSNYDLKMIELFKKEINQAKELEKQKIIDAYESKVTEVLAEEYYTETYEERRNK